tara:strand:- start:662 stop:877 length:216 start_codon:yes stop_codon:yes gene_type:complete
MNTKQINWINILLLFFLFSMLVVFSIISISLRPLADWANYQNDCIYKESIDTTIPWAVRKCNGRSKVYQVK